MIAVVRRVVGVCAVLLASAPALSAPISIGVLLPTRHRDAPLLLQKAEEVAKIIGSEQAFTSAERPLSDPKLEADLRLAATLWTEGRFDQAAVALDSSLELAAREPHRVSNVSQLVAATVNRASIALARRENDRATALLERLLRYDPTFELRSDERSPKLVAALERSRRQLGSPPPLRSQELAQACKEADLVVAARFLNEREVEFTRFDRCLIVASQIAEIAVAPAAVAAGLSVHTSLPQKPDDLGRVHFQAGERFFALRSYESAIAEFQAGYGLTHRPGFLWNIAQSYARLGRSDEAKRTYEEFLRAKPESPMADAARAWLSDHARNLAAAAPAKAQPLVVSSPRPERSHSIVKKWWLWTAVGVVVVGTAITLGVVLGAQTKDPVPNRGVVSF